MGEPSGLPKVLHVVCMVEMYALSSWLSCERMF